ncbi:unnamed protein product [Durusdinium trenchii]|uniref:Nuclear control of ATPase protein 2 n=1 Tax=Durusdinium trenchii TaxID=1381693 RepID=A0ABP0SM72_9DINO
MQYEGLPFVGHRRLRNFLAHWYEQGSPLNLLDASPEAPSLDEDAGEINEEAIFLKDYFQSQEKAFHILLNFVSEVSIHLNYWLDWTTPIHRRPRWAHQWARKLWRSYLALLGRRRPLAQPERAAAEFARLSEDLCRLLAFIQITSFDLLSSELGSLEARTEALRRSLAGLKWQTRVAAITAARLSPGGTAMVPRRSMRHSWLGSMGSETALSEQVAALSERSGGCGPEEEPSTRYPGRDQLRESDLTFQVLVESLNRYIWESGQLSHWRKWWPVYGLAFLGVLVGAWRWRLGEREVRHGLVQHSAEVWRQFLNEWILLPFQQLWEALLLPGPKEELRVQLRDLRAEEEALERMVTSFARFARAESTFAVKGKEGVEDAALPELYFEWSMTNPISNVVTGHLAESCMVQSQKLKVLLYASLYSIDAVMMQLKWDFLMAGVMPTTLLCGCVSWIISSSRRRRQLESRRKMVRALAELDRFLNRNMAFLSPRRVNELPQMEGAVGTVPLKSLLSQALGLDEDPELPSNGLASGLDSSIDLDKVGAALCHLVRDPTDSVGQRGETASEGSAGFGTWHGRAVGKRW